ncbi:aryl carrier-like protein [Streptomyces sp. SAI-144]|uniref:phosphopantetheine-binding protein n=1 Tax=unclassified Streptomyces TaxID=2593676 RepID=UPI002475E12D|nr:MULTISPECIES: phosphopantetheine-binding protein [unclassified Streptomyces]MDH6440256.1 aryl carrier-like protein [Streptomyces sp. SAI-144]MDH6487573.1 aryl carrier-like protein [Streptomyces sp. SAI-127]
MPDNTLTAPADLELLRSLWREVLEIEEMADDLNFFDAGGDSLRLVALVERIRQETGLRVRTMDVLQAATVRGQADLLAGLARS